MLIDSHVHLADRKFSPDLDRVLARGRDAGIERFVNIAADMASSRAGLQLARRHDEILCTVGVHPHDERRYRPENDDELRSMAGDPRVVAIGEIGLDYHYPDFRKQGQLEVFERQAALATELSLPMVIHCRDAYDDLIEFFRLRPAITARGVVHCYSGTVAQARALVDLGFYLGIGGAVTYPGATEMRQVVREVGLDRIVLETDAPYLPPQKKRGRRNEPSYLKFAVADLAELTGFEYRDVARITTANTRRLYGLRETSEAEIAYSLRKRLYLNVTNRCTNACGHCERNTDYMLFGHWLRLPGEPSARELLDAIESPERYEEFVICGLGEPTLRLDVVLEVARELSAKGRRVRLNTNGHGAAIHGRDIAQDLAGIVSAVTVTMNAHDRATYDRLSCPCMPGDMFQAMLDFTRAARPCVPDVRLKLIVQPGVDVEACRRIAEDELKVKFQTRMPRVPAPAWTAPPGRREASDAGSRS